MHKVLSIVVVTSSVFSLSVNVRVGKVRIAVALYQLCLEFAMSVGQVNDKNAAVGCLVVTVVAMEEASLVGTLFRPEILGGIWSNSKYQLSKLIPIIQ